MTHGLLGRRRRAATDPRGHRHDALRRGRRRVGQDRGAGRPGHAAGAASTASRLRDDRRRHVHREGRRGAARPAARARCEKVEQGPDRTSGARRAAALDDLDGAAIGTLHSFAQRILTEHPIEAGLPPLIEVLDEVGSSVAFEERWASSCSASSSTTDAIAERAAAGARRPASTLEHLRVAGPALQLRLGPGRGPGAAAPAPEPPLPARRRCRARARPPSWSRARDECTDADGQVPRPTCSARRLGRRSSQAAQ